MSNSHPAAAPAAGPHVPHEFPWQMAAHEPADQPVVDQAAIKNEFPWQFVQADYLFG